MTKYRISELIYLVISVISVREAYLLWNSNPKRAYLFSGFFVVSIFMFFFRRYTRKKINK
jgi:hypothetical protein